MKIYLFGNRDHAEDSLAFVVADKIMKKMSGQIIFEEVKPNQDLPFAGKEKVILMDAVMGIEKVTLITHEHLEKLILPPRSSAHDYDLSFQLQYLLKLGKLKEIYIVGLPMQTAIDYDSIQFIFKKLVAQDMQGS